MLIQADLFSGVGGMALAGQRAGFTLIGLCEIEPFCRNILKSHFEDVPISEDVHGISGADLKPLDLLTGGFPIQANFSRGDRRENDPRSLWDEFARIAREARPTWVVAETIPRFSTIGLDDAQWDLERAGYATTALVLPAQAFRCPLRKDRLFLVGALMGSPRSLPGEPGRIEGLEVPAWEPPRPGLHRVAERSAEWLDFIVAGLNALGDATVPGPAGAILRAIADVETEWQSQPEGATA